MPSRRDILKLAAVGGAVAVLPLERAMSAALAAADPAPSTPFAHAMPVPPVLEPVKRLWDRDVYEVTMKEAKHEVVKGLQSTVRTYNGHFPGPTIMASRGRTAVVRQTNGLGVNTAVHLHGGHLPAEHDGHPTDIIEPGKSREYVYANEQRAASLWYHDHAHHLEAQNVYHGLQAAYLLTDQTERALGLPSGRFDVPLMIRDVRVEADGSLIYTRASARPHMLVNGKERPYFQVTARRYRFRVYNVSIDRFLRLRLADGAEYLQIGTDGGLLPFPVPTTEILLSAGERADIVVDFSRYRPGTSVVLQNAGALGTENADVLRFDIVGVASGGDPSTVPAKLADLPPLPAATVERRFELSTDPVSGWYVINGLTYEPDRVDVRTTLGTTEIWTIVNTETPSPPPNFHLHHNFHTHLAQFRVLDRNGQKPAPGEAGLKDTVMVAPGDTVRIQMTWTGHRGRFVYHCHQLPHSAEAQMGTIEIS